ncbi:prostaglandin D2 receptor 2-like [Poeciliopsis prolifica]|uniref:prostaglandin D2 receptor 2-like n=1 Tax=Poeciliopsis prolifica TaxID=188132 RepID=UPI002413E090|nr:prostaglandin D2 receptor 2-like [Poeciliopsis prolifica]XP_054881236.1 prostaglandin D2 receptor 2-like [Poeciliopsis prolifica]XP_054881237.1 prostaglandin D2 receptor 2-like [Poeciliopsis prolifica]
MACFLPNNSVTSSQTCVAQNLTSMSIFNASFIGIVSVIGIAENLLILAVVGFRVSRSIISVWILNLAASDLMATLTLPFFSLYHASGQSWILGSTFCRIYSYVFFLNMYVSAFLLAAISLDRCLVVMQPVWAQNYRSIQLVGKICCVIWGLAILLTIPFFMFRDTISIGNGKCLCYYSYSRYLLSEPVDLQALCRHRKVGLAFMKLFFAFLLPLAIIILSYIFVNSSLAQRGCRRSFRFVRLVIAVVVTFVLCWAPYHLFIVIEVMAPKQSSAQNVATKVLPISATIGFLNSVLNPILYVFSCPDLCRKIKHSFGAVMESVLAEDLAEWTRRRSTVRSSISNSEYSMKKKHSVSTSSPKDTDSDQVENLSNSAEI